MSDTQKDTLPSSQNDPLQNNIKTDLNHTSPLSKNGLRRAKTSLNSLNKIKGMIHFIFRKILWDSLKKRAKFLFFYTTKLRILLQTVLIMNFLMKKCTKMKICI